MRALIVYPEVEDDTYWSFHHVLPWIGKRSSIVPLGPPTLAAALPESYDVRLIDMNVTRLRKKDVQWADILFTSSAVVQRESHRHVATLAREEGKPLVAGGPFPTQFYDEMEADHLILGELESGVLDDFLKDFAAGEAKRIYARPVLDRKRSVERAMDSALLEDLVDRGADVKQRDRRPPMEESPVPRFDLLDADAYGSWAIQVSRGCPHSCTFCSEPALWGHTMRIKAPEQVVRELQEVRATGYTGPLFVVDDNFVGNRQGVKPVLEAMRAYQEREGYPFQLYTEADIGLAKDERLMALMRDAGFTMVFVGLETPNEQVLREMRKGQNLGDLRQAVRHVQSYGLEVSAGFILGNDGEPPEAGAHIVDFCQETGIPLAMVGLLTVARGSELYERYRAEGRLLDETSGNNLDARLNFIPARAFQRGAPAVPDSERIIAEESKPIVEGYKAALAELYDGANYFARCERLFEHLGSRPSSSGVRGSQVRALANSLLRQSVGKAYSPHYRSFLARTWRERRDLLPEAVAYGVKLHHFQKVTERILNS